MPHESRGKVICARLPGLPGAADRNDVLGEWADKYRFLSSESAAEHGKWTTLPFQRGPLNAVSDARIYRVVIKSATQMLKTETILNGIGYFAHMDPGPILVLQPRDDDAKAFSKERIAPMIRDTPALREIISAAKGRAADNTLEEKFFTGGMLAITSAGSPGNLARRAIRLLFADECDNYPVSAGPEGNPISLARERLATFRHRRKEILACSPTVDGSEIDRVFAGSDKREFFVPRPHCGHYQSLMLAIDRPGSEVASWEVFLCIEVASGIILNMNRLGQKGNDVEFPSKLSNCKMFGISILCNQL
jgi:phage terminase large subunit GpA-like protein